MKIIPSYKIGDIDKYTIQHEPIPSINLMERASAQIFGWIKQRFPYHPFWVFAGPGNNGGDALAVARMLLHAGFGVKILLYSAQKLSSNAQINLERLKNIGQADIIDLSTHSLPREIPPQAIVIDGIFGSGLTRPLTDRAAAIVHFINNRATWVISIDVPSGLFCENNEDNLRENIVQATFTLTFQAPKLAFLFPENNKNVGHWVVLPIGLDAGQLANTQTNWQLTTPEEIKKRMPPRGLFDHKGTLGHALLIAGSYGKMGAAILSSSACLRSGTGLLTTHLPREALPILQTALPEAMAAIDRSDLMFTQFPDLEPFQAIGIGPGLGTSHNTQRALAELIEAAQGRPMVIDADGLNILSANPGYLKRLSPGTILTPHPKEFERLAGKWNSDYQRMQKAIDFAANYKVVLVLKGAWSMIVEPEGRVFFNPTGNPGMATAGSGDALTGVILALLARGMQPLDAALTGVYVHGLAGDLALKKEGTEGIIASDIIAHLGKAFKQIMQIKD